MAKATLKQIKKSRKAAYARAYLTGRDHYKHLQHSDHISVRGSAKRGYRRGLKDAHFEAKQRRRYNGEE